MGGLAGSCAERGLYRHQTAASVPARLPVATFVFSRTEAACAVGTAVSGVTYDMTSAAAVMLVDHGRLLSIGTIGFSDQKRRPPNRGDRLTYVGRVIPRLPRWGERRVSRLGMVLASRGVHPGGAHRHTFEPELQRQDFVERT